MAKSLSIGIIWNLFLHDLNGQIQENINLQFMMNNEPVCTPEDEELLRKDGSYPSGHTAIGWAWAPILYEVFPEKTNDIIARAYGVHPIVLMIYLGI
jgi:membrane-associated phospholipid phosphatase